MVISVDGGGGGIYQLGGKKNHISKDLELRKNRMQSGNTEEFNLIRLYF